MVCQKVKELTRPFQDNDVGPCGSSMVLRDDGLNVERRLLLHCVRTLVGAAHFPHTLAQVIHLNLLMVGGYEQTDWPVQ